MDGSPSIRLHNVYLYECYEYCTLYSCTHTLARMTRSDLYLHNNDMSHACTFDDLYPHNIMLGCMHEQTAHAHCTPSCKIVRFRRLIIYNFSIRNRKVNDHN